MPVVHAVLLAWSVWALSVLLVVPGIVLQLPGLMGGTTGPTYWLNNAVAALAFSTVGAIVLAQRPANRIGRLFVGAGLIYGLAVFTDGYGAYASLSRDIAPAAGLLAWVASWLWVPGGSLILFSLLIFPDGHLPSSRWRAAAWSLVGATLLATISFALPSSWSGGSMGLVVSFSRLLLGVCGILCVAALFIRFRQAVGEERQQFKWVAYAAGVLLLAITASSVSQAADESLISRFLFFAGFLAFPLSIGIAVLRYRLWEIDLIVNRTLVYGALTACIVGIYVLVVGYLGALFRTEENLPISLVATGLVAVLFAPLRYRLQRGINRLMYGERDEPYAAVSRLGERLEGTLAPEAVLPAIVETVREALKLPYAAIALPQDSSFEVAVASGELPGEPLVLPLSYGGETVGRLLLAPRMPGEGFSTADRDLLEGLARHAGVAVHGVLVMADLRRSRESLVLAREEERRRLRRDLHDELAPTLAALGLSAATVGELIPTDPREAASTNERLRAAIRATVGDVRRLVYDLRPPALDELGLVEAVRERASHYGANDEGFLVTVQAPKALPSLPAAVEVAAYRIVQEALANVSRHARARRCSVRLACPDGRALEVEVIDDGVGLPDQLERGVGIRSMRERAAELGGTCKIGPASPQGASLPGTRIFARLPLAELPLEGRPE